MTVVSVTNLARRKRVPRFAYTAVVEKTLPGWDISLAFVSPQKALALNKQLRGAVYVPNVLSYALGEQSGEIIICLKEAERQASAYGMSVREFVLYLFIHGLLHLKGWAHGSTMEQWERKILAHFAPDSMRISPYGTAHSYRHRHRHVPSKGGRRRRAQG